MLKKSPLIHLVGSLIAIDYAFPSLVLTRAGSMGLISAAMAPQSYLINLSLTSLSENCNHSRKKSFLWHELFSAEIVFTTALQAHLCLPKRFRLP